MLKTLAAQVKELSLIHILRRSTNGGGENSPMLEGEDDFYELFFASLETVTK